MNTPRIQWESNLSSIRQSVANMIALMKDSKVSLEEDTFEIYTQLDEMLITVNYLTVLTDQHQYICQEDYDCDIADNQDHVEYDDWA